VGSDYIFMPTKQKKSSNPDEIKKVEKAKLNALLAGVIFFMALIIILWIADLPAMLAVAPKKNNDQFNINQISQQLQATFSQAKSRINAIKSLTPATLQKYATQVSTSTAPTSTVIEK
jgi:hypothetical protein